MSVESFTSETKERVPSVIRRTIFYDTGALFFCRKKLRKSVIGGILNNSGLSGINECSFLLTVPDQALQNKKVAADERNRAGFIKSRGGLLFYGFKIDPDTPIPPQAIKQIRRLKKGRFYAKEAKTQKKRVAGFGKNGRFHFLASEYQTPPAKKEKRNTGSAPPFTFHGDKAGSAKKTFPPLMLSTSV